jgi:hypothetical protein
MAIPKIEPHMRYEDLPRQMASDSRNSFPAQNCYQTESAVTDSVNKSVREDGVVNIRDFLTHAARAESAADFIHRLEEEDEEQNPSPFKRSNKLKSPTKRLMRRERKKSSGDKRRSG